MARHQFYEIMDGDDPILVSPPGTHSGVDITIQNLGPGFVIIGGEGITQENFGFLIAPGGAWSVELPPKDSLYIAADIENPDPELPVASVAVLSVSLEHQN
jgi:hypothetical protein